MKNGRPTIPGILLVMFMIMNIVLAVQAMAVDGSDYRSMVNRIEKFFDKALSLYEEGNIAEAKLNAQAAYFEVFENMEGPIRINISARKNFELEEEFVNIRNMIKDREPAESIEEKIHALVTELNAVIPQLEGGFELVAEAGGQTAQEISTVVSDSQSGVEIEPVWRNAVETIQGGLEGALTAYRSGDAEGAAMLVRQTQFDGYKNTLLETAVRRYVSQGRDYEYNNSFSELTGMIRNSESPEELEQRGSALIASLKRDLKGLPVIDGALSKGETVKRIAEENRRKDWVGVTDTLFGEMDKAVMLYERGEKARASVLVQDAYFDVFEESGMEAKIGSMDAAFKSKLEGHFSMIVGQMKKGASPDNIAQTMTAMKSDFAKAEVMLGRGSDSPFAMFFYSLMIILREGFEAILIISAIVAYLVKTDHSDKLRVICNGCISALALSVVTAVFVKWIFNVSAASQEILEGGTMLLAAAVLFSVSYWLISKVEAKKWTSYIKGKVSSSLSSGSLKALWFVAFLAVYREGAETVLFYQALAADASAAGITWISAGFVIGCIMLAGIYIIMKFGAVRLPIRPFFLGTGALLYYMAFVFTGKGMMELIEGKVFEPSVVSWMPSVSFIGVYPYWQTVIPQLFLVAAALAALGIMMKQRGVTAGAVSPEKEVNVNA